MNLSDKNVLVYDGGGLFVSLALRLAALKQFKSVTYFREWQESFCNGNEFMVGTGLEEFGVDRLKYFWKDPETGEFPVNNYDLIIFPDCWDPDLQEYLRSIGKRVWGAGFKANLEQSRWNTRETLRKVGLPVNEAERIEGVEALREYLKKHENVFVKISTFRGMAETFESKNYIQSKNQVDQLEADYAAIMEQVYFIIEKQIPDADEVGYDGYCIDGEFPDKSFYGFEIKNKAYVGKLVDYDELPEEVKNVNTKLSYAMDGYRQFWSSELRNEYPIDFTARHASPAGETFCQAFDNLPEILWEGADGKLVHAKISAKFVAQVILCSEWARTHTLPIQFPEEIRENVKIYNHCRINGVDQCVTDNTHSKEVGSVVATGATLEEACKAAKELAKKVSAYQLYDNSDSLEAACKEMEASK